MFGSKPEAPGRRQTRQRKVSQRMAVVDDAARAAAVQSRLDALEADNEAGDAFGLDDSDDEEFVMGEGGSDDDMDLGGRGKKRKGKGGSKRRTRGGRDTGPRSFARLLEESGLEAPGAEAPNYLTAAAGPSAAHAPRKLCSVCGQLADYNCARCGSRFCCRKCFGVHTETRCLKFTV